MDMGFGGSQIWKRAAGHSRYGIISCPQIDRTDWSRAVDRKLAVPWARRRSDPRSGPLSSFHFRSASAAQVLFFFFNQYLRGRLRSLSLLPFWKGRYLDQARDAFSPVPGILLLRRESTRAADLELLPRRFHHVWHGFRDRNLCNPGVLEQKKWLAVSLWCGEDQLAARGYQAATVEDYKQ